MMKMIYDPEYDKVVDESYVKRQYEAFKKNYSWFNKSYENFLNDNFVRIEDESELRLWSAKPLEELLKGVC